MRSLRIIFDDFMREIDLVERFTIKGKMLFMTDERDQYAVMMAYARIGEIAKQIPNDLLDTQPQIAWREIKGFRDVLLHRYFEINIERVWEAVEDLPNLRLAVEALSANVPADDEDNLHLM